MSNGADMVKLLQRERDLRVEVATIRLVAVVMSVVVIFCLAGGILAHAASAWFGLALWSVLLLVAAWALRRTERAYLSTVAEIVKRYDKGEEETHDPS